MSKPTIDGPRPSSHRTARFRVWFGHQLRSAMRARGLTNAQVAEALGVDRTTVSSYRGGRTLPDLERLVRLASALDLSVGELLGEVAP